MTRRWALWLIAADLLAVVVLAFAYPHLMVSPGVLRDGHGDLGTDCFACHAPWRGASSVRCIACHDVADIGLRSTQGVALPRVGIKASFHQELLERDCMVCHVDHVGPQKSSRGNKRFSHSLLRPVTRDRCAACHAAPQNDLHRDLSVPCGRCHRQDGWKPAAFDHALLAQSELARCETCHKAPGDRLHRQVNGRCTSCHVPRAWKPSTFAHDKAFVLDADHNVSCAACHEGDDFRRYTCYGCHEHTPSRVRAQHEGEGGRNLDNCVACHRGAHGNGEGGSSRDGRERD